LTPPKLRAASASDYNFVVNFIGDINARENSVEESRQSSLVRITSGDESATAVTL